MAVMQQQPALKCENEALRWGDEARFYKELLASSSSL